MLQASMMPEVRRRNGYDKGLGCESAKKVNWRKILHNIGISRGFGTEPVFHKKEQDRIIRAKVFFFWGKDLPYVCKEMPQADGRN